MFKGEYSHSLDSKGRVIMPAKFREILGGSFVVTKGLDGCLFVYPNDEWKNIENKFREKPLSSSKDARKFMRFFFAGAADCEADSQGRVVIPPVLREFAGLEKDVVLVGLLTRIEIWSRERWQSNEYADDEMDEISEHMAAMDLGF